MTNGITVLPPYPNSGSTNPNRNRNIHAEMVKVLDSAPGWQRIASNYGTGGTGLDATGQANPSGEEAWAVWRNVSGSTAHDVAIKWSWTNFYTAGQFEGGASNWGVGLSVAFHSSSQAWNGSTNNNGSDTFPSGQPWKSGSLVFPRQNASGGVHQTEGDREYMGLFSLSLAQGNMISVVDNDNIFFAYNDTNVSNSAGTHETVFYFGKYTPESGSNVLFPYIYFCEEASSSPGNIFVPLYPYGGLTENNDRNHGLGFVSSSIPDVTNFILSYGLSTTTNSGTIPVTSGSTLQEFPIYILRNESLSVNPGIDDVGVIGRLDFIRATRASDVANLDRVDNDSKLILSRSWTVQTANSFPSLITIPWISGTLMPTGSSTDKITNFVLPVTGTVETSVKTFRGTIDGSFVYNVGSPPSGAINIVIVKET